MGNIPNLPLFIQDLFYVCCTVFGFSMILGIRCAIRGEGEKASTLFAIAIMVLFALLPYLISGDWIAQSVGI